MTTKITSANIDATVASTTSLNTAVAPVDSNTFNISLLGFKMAVNEGLTVFNLVDGVVDEFNDESGTDEAEGSNDTYYSTDDFYANYTTTPASISAGFGVNGPATEPDTSTAGTNTCYSLGTYGSFTVPNGLVSVSAYVWGAGGGTGYGEPGPHGGGGGGFVCGTLSVSNGQVLKISSGEGGFGHPSSGTDNGGFGGYGPVGTEAGNYAGGGKGAYAGGGGLAGIFSPSVDFTASVPTGCVPNVYLVAGSGGGGGGHSNGCGGAGGGACGQAGTHPTYSGGGGTQSAGGTGGPFGPGSPATDNPGGFLYGGDSQVGGGSGGGAGYYGGGAGGGTPQHGAGGGGSGYIGHPQISSATSEGGTTQSGGGTASPLYSPIPQGLTSPTTNPAGALPINEGGSSPGLPGNGNLMPAGGDGYVLLTGSYCAVGCTTSTTIVSTGFTSTSVATNSRIVLFEENVDTPTLNTDIIASVSRDGGTTFTNVTLADSGYVTGSSGQRILTGQADISGQPSGQSMRWKLALANNKVKIHGVSLQWS